MDSHLLVQNIFLIVYVLACSTSPWRGVNLRVRLPHRDYRRGIAHRPPKKLNQEEEGRYIERRRLGLNVSAAQPPTCLDVTHVDDANLARKRETVATSL